MYSVVANSASSYGSRIGGSASYGSPTPADDWIESDPLPKAPLLGSEFMPPSFGVREGCAGSHWIHAYSVATMRQYVWAARRPLRRLTKASREAGTRSLRPAHFATRDRSL